MHTYVDESTPAIGDGGAKEEEVQLSAARQTASTLSWAYGRGLPTKPSFAWRGLPRVSSSGAPRAPRSVLAPEEGEWESEGATLFAWGQSEAGEQSGAVGEGAERLLHGFGELIGRERRRRLTY